jgi:uncharacterized membrane protein YbhN (UPF0104 family)
MHRISAPFGTARTRVRRLALFLIALLVVGWASRHLAAAGASWSAAWHSILGLSWVWLGVLSVTWLLGLSVHTVVLVAAMPGLTHRRALTLNLSGSAVSNVLPLGGIAGTALNLGMIRGWGHQTTEFARFVVVSKGCDLVAKLALPGVAVGGLMMGGLLPPGTGALWLAGSVGGLVAGWLIVAGLAGQATPLLRLAIWAERTWHAARRVGPGRDAGQSADRHAGGWSGAVATLMDGTDRLVRHRWPNLAGGTIAYWFLQGLLLWLCMTAIGAAVPVPVLFAGFVIERSLTLLALTPGGAGLVEAGTVGVLIALGTEPSAALAGVLLFRGFVYAAEIPVGGLVILGWLVSRHVAGSRPGRSGRCPGTDLVACSTTPST